MTHQVDQTQPRPLVAAEHDHPPARRRLLTVKNRGAALVGRLTAEQAAAFVAIHRSGRRALASTLSPTMRSP